MLPKEVSQLLKTCQIELGKVVKHTEKIDEKGEAASKRTIDALARAKAAVLTGIANLHALEKAHGLTNIASDFTEKNKDILSKFSTESSQIPEFHNTPVSPKAPTDVPEPHEHKHSEPAANGIAETHVPDPQHKPATDGNVLPASVAPSGPGTPLNANAASGTTVVASIRPPEAEHEALAQDVRLRGTQVLSGVPHSAPGAQAAPASPTPAPDMPHSAPGTRATPITSIRPPQAEHEAHDVGLGETQVRSGISGGNPSSMTTEQDGLQNKKHKQPEAKSDDTDYEEKPGAGGHNPKKRANGRRSKSKPDISSGDDKSSEEDTNSDEDDRNSGVKSRKRKRSAKKSQGRSKKVKKSRRAKKAKKGKAASESNSNSEDSAWEYLTDKETSEDSEKEIRKKICDPRYFSVKDNNTKFRDLDEEEKLIKEDEAKAAVKHFLLHPYSTQIDAHIRRLIRENQSVAPEAATTSRELAMECLTTSHMNMFCPYHHAIDKAGKTVDGKEGLKYILNGVPKPRRLITGLSVKKLKDKPSALFKSNKQLRNPRVRDGFLNCGCSINDALTEFYFWKTWSLSGNVNGNEVTESMGDQRMTPRIRAFVVKAFEEATCLTIDDLYIGKIAPIRHQEKMYLTQLQRILAKFNALQAELGGSTLRLEDVGDGRIPRATDGDFEGFQ